MLEVSRKSTSFNKRLTRISRRNLPITATQLIGIVKSADIAFHFQVDTRTSRAKVGFTDFAAEPDVEFDGHFIWSLLNANRVVGFVEC